MMTNLSHPLAPHDLRLDYREPGIISRLCTLVHGLACPRQTRAYKEAVIELQRLSAPLAAIAVPLLVLLLAMLLPEAHKAPEDRYTVDMIIEDTFIDLKEVAPPDKTAPTLTDTPEFTFATPRNEVPTEAPPTPTDQPRTSLINSLPVLSSKSPVKLRPVYGDSRGADRRKQLRARFDGDQPSEDAVMRALRWLKKNQQPDGSWKNQTVAMTGLAVLTFLAHGEVPDTGTSPEFGDSVGRALAFLLERQKPDGHFRGADGNEYAHPIATYALCEAYGMTLNPNVRAAAERALIPIIRGQHPTGGWTYRMDPSLDKTVGKYRDDSSYMGWCAQALKAAYMAQLKSEGLDKALKLAVRGFKANASPDGGFGYTGPGKGGLTAVGTLCLQLLGGAQEPEVRKSLALMADWTPSFRDKTPIGNSPQYYSYYTTQAKFHEGGKVWDRWNREMKTLYVKTQQIGARAAEDDKGAPVDIGWWSNGDAHTDRPVMDTCLAALQLMVYYRSLPTTSMAAVSPDESLTFASAPMETNDLQVIINNL